MEFDSVTHSVGMAAQVFFLDLLLSGDNALVIALACRSLPPRLMSRAVLLGTGFAIALRVLLTMLASVLLDVPFLKLIGAVLLIIIALKLLLDDDGTEEEATLKSRPESNQLWGAVLTVVTADVVLSLDNVVALAAATQGSVLFLVLGLLLSIPLLMYGSLFINRLLANYPVLIPAGSALLAWLAGQIAVSDPLVASWVETQAPALSVVVPMLCVVFVLCESRIIREQRQGLVPPPPLNLFSGIAQRLSRLGEADTPDATQPQYAQAALSPVVAEAQPAVVESRLAMTFSEPVAVAMVPAVEGLPQAVALPEEALEDEEEASSSAPESRLLKVLIWSAVVIGVLGLGWIMTHLMSQGFLPTPEHPFKPQAYSR